MTDLDNYKFCMGFSVYCLNDLTEVENNRIS